MSLPQPKNCSDEPSATSSDGQSAPLGATALSNGVNFSLFSRGAAAVDLLSSANINDARRSRSLSPWFKTVLVMKTAENRLGDDAMAGANPMATRHRRSHTYSEFRGRSHATDFRRYS